MLTPTPEDYRRELEYLQAEQQHSQAFTYLLARFPNPSQELLDTLRSLRSSATKTILDPEKLKQLQQENPELYNQIITVYTSFLEEKI